MELSRVAGNLPQDRICEAASDNSSECSHEDDDPVSSTVTCRVHIKQATGLPLSLAHYVFCHYTFWNYDEVVVPQRINAENSQKHSTTAKFDDSRDFTVTLSEEFIEHCAGKFYVVYCGSDEKSWHSF